MRTIKDMTKPIIAAQENDTLVMEKQKAEIDTLRKELAAAKTAMADTLNNGMREDYLHACDTVRYCEQRLNALEKHQASGLTDADSWLVMLENIRAAYKEECQALCKKLLEHLKKGEEITTQLTALGEQLNNAEQIIEHCAPGDSKAYRAAAWGRPTEVFEYVCIHVDESCSSVKEALNA